VRVYITTQVIQRELDSRLLLAAHLTKLGHTVSLGPRPALRVHRALHGPGVYVLSNASRKSFIERGDTAGLAFVILDEEALLLDDAGEFAATRVDVDVARTSVRYFCWGPHHQEVVLAAAPESAPSLRITGNPRFELLEPRFRAIYREESEAIRDRYGQHYVLVNSNIHESDEAPWLVEMRAWLKELACRLAAHRPDVTVVFRPHPADLTHAQVDDGGLPNLTVTCEGPIAPWLVGATAVFHNSCTTAIEGRIMQRPVFAFRPMEDPQYGSLANAVSVTVRTLDEACAALDAVLADDVPVHPDLAPLDRYVVRPGSGEPSRRIAEEISGIEISDDVAGTQRSGPFERLRTRWRGAPAKPWNRIPLRAQLPAIRKRYALIAAAAGLDHAVTIKAPQPALLDVTPR
jgi:hypothetical protein